MRLIDADKYEEKLRGMMPKFDEENNTACIEGQTISFCIEALRSMQTIEKLPNDPLTEEELREMDGDKIYVHYIDGFYTNEDCVMLIVTVQVNAPGN